MPGGSGIYINRMFTATIWQLKLPGSGGVDECELISLGSTPLFAAAADTQPFVWFMHTDVSICVWIWALESRRDASGFVVIHALYFWLTKRRVQCKVRQPPILLFESVADLWLNAPWSHMYILGRSKHNTQDHSKHRQPLIVGWRTISVCQSSRLLTAEHRTRIEKQRFPATSCVD